MKQDTNSFLAKNTLPAALPMRIRCAIKQTLITSALLVSAGTAFASPTLVTEVEGISEYKLDNGLQLLLFPDQSKETVTVNVTYRVGSKHENYGETGMAHLLEHLVFKGSPRHKDIPSELSSHGARPNGSTWTDRTNYFETFTATEENINWALDMEADRMVNSFIAKKDLDSEMTVVRNEFERGENSAFGVTLKRLMAAAFSWHNYGKSTIGAKSDLENVPIARLQAFYRKYYQPDNATLIIAGKFTPEEMLTKVDHYFAAIPKPTRALPPLYTAEPAQDGEKQITLRRVGDIQLYASAYHIPAGSHPDYSALEVLSGVIGGTPRGRLHKAIVEEKLASRTYGFNFQWAEPGIAIFAAEVDQASDLDKTIAAVNSVIEGVATNKITDKEVEQVKISLIKGFELGFNSSENIALELSEWLGMGDWRLMFLHRDRIEAVTTAEVQAVAEKYLTRNNRTAGRFIPTEAAERVEIPATGSIAAMLDGYQGREPIAEGELFDPSFENIDQRTEVVKLGDNLTLAILNKKTRGESVTITLGFDIGDEKSLRKQTDIADAVGAMLQRGTTRYSREELQDEFDKLKASVGISGGVVGFNISITTKRDKVKEVLDLAAHVVKQPNFDKAEFEQYISTLKVDLEKSMQNPQSLVFNEMRRLHSGNDKHHPYYVPTYEEALKAVSKLKIRKLKKFHKKFYGSSHGQISIVGDVDSEAVQQQLRDLFGDWQSGKDYKRIAKDYAALAVEHKNFDTPDKENAVFVATMALNLNDTHADTPALVLGNYILGGGFLNSRLASRLRQKDGLSYSAGSFFRPASIDDNSLLGAYAICAPQNLKKVELGFKEEIARLLKDGVTQEEVDSAISGILQGTKVSRSQDSELNGKLRKNLYLDRTMAWSKDFETKLAALTPDQVHAAMQRHIKLESFVLITGGDLSKQ